MFKGLFASAAAAALMTATTAGAAAPVAQSTVARAATPVQDDSQLGAQVPTGTLISIGILAALIVIVLVATKGGSNSGNTPTSP